MRNNAKFIVFDRLDGGQIKWLKVPVNIVEAIHIGDPTRNVNAHLIYAITLEIDVWNGDPEYALDVIQDITKPDIRRRSIEASSLVGRCHGWLPKFGILPCVRVAVIGAFIVILANCLVGHMCPIRPPMGRKRPK
jgi:hypothetical protein